MAGLPAVRVSRKGADRVVSGHPWIFLSDVIDRGAAQPGDAVHVFGPGNRPLGTAHFSAASQITLRLLARELITPDAAFFRARIAQAAAFRRRTVENSDAYRLVYGEGDQLPALIVDRYGDCLVIQTLNQGMDRSKAEIIAVLNETLAPGAIVERNDVAIRAREDLPLSSGVLAGELPEPIAVLMNGMRWRADLLHGQKTGVFLDQRENYMAAVRYARGRALDCFTATGGFALHIAGRCEHVEAIDSSASTLATAEANRDANGIRNVTFREADAFEALAMHVHARQRFDTIVLDPPAFAKSRQAVEGAARGYKEINLRALRLLGPGGILVTCSCSHHFSEAMLLETVAAAALDAGRVLRVLERRTQSQDHPILLTVPETHYLKCLVLEVI
ncbi:MAG TPA: class I SAM-dependent rRNA methyltransferase [Bryobacteraceae bacterium]|nr:class I SAM-dependent rRNA methyltransferase [Bryobacteraceae bacterium]